MSPSSSISSSPSPTFPNDPYDSDYVKASILAAYQKRANYRVQAKAAGWLDRPNAIGDGVNGEVYATVPRPQVLDYYMVKIIGRVGEWGSLNPSLQYVGPSQYGWSEEDDFYWERRILFPWLFVKAPTPAPAPERPTVVTTPPPPPPLSASQQAARGSVSQGGLLQDDILYNLSLLCANVLGPLKRRYPNIIVVSGLRQFNTGMSQHEKGEAADIQINGQTDELLYQVADYISKNLQFDQLILNYSNQPRLSWIHVSFSAQELRRSVLTRDYDDSYHEGLYLIEPLTGEARAEAQRQMNTDMAAIDKELSILSARSNAITPITINAEGPVVETTATLVEDPSVIDNESTSNITTTVDY